MNVFKVLSLKTQNVIVYLAISDHSTESDNPHPFLSYT